MNFKRIGILLLVLLPLSGCTLVPHPGNNRIETAPGLWVTLPSPAELGYSVTASQLIQATWNTGQGNRQQQLPVQLEVSPEKLILAGFSSWGTRILSLTYQNNDIQTEVLSGLSETLPDPRQILFNLMITLWPRNAWEDRLNAVRWRVIDKEYERLVINERGERIIEIHYDAIQPFEGKIHFVNHQLGYTITIDTLNHQTARNQHRNP